VREAAHAGIAVVVVLGGLALAGVLGSTKPGPPSDPVTTVPPKRAAQERTIAAAAESARCPAMTNPGGLDWRPASDPGPHPTDGTVSVPALRVEAPIVKVGVAQNGKMVVPTNPRDVAWLHQGAFPGETQNAVLAGHVSYSGTPGVFSKLRGLEPGSGISVEIDGKRWQFRVTWNCLFDRDTALAAKIMGRTDVPSVTLISCGGVFDRAARTHTKRIAVRGELVG
jgi:sortase (surface protein transpeptidase)